MNKIDHQIEAVIFDWAGTTVDFGCFAPVQAFVEVFKQYGIEPTMEEVREPMGMLKIDHIRTMLGMPRIRQCWVEKYGKEPGEEEAQQLFSIFEEKLLSILHLYADPKPGTVEAVNAIKAKGIRVGSTRIRAGVLVQSGFHRTERKTVPLYDLPQHGSAGN